MEGAKQNIIEAIGNTPIVQLSPDFTRVESEICVKLEYMNPGGSTKDRIGVYMIQQAVKNNKLQPGGTIIEGTSGNTGVGIAIYAALNGYQCIFVTNDKQSQDKIDNLRAYGAQVVVCPTDVKPEDPRSYYNVSKQLAESIPNSYYVNQYDNLWNRETHYKFTAPEIHRQTKGDFDTFIAAVGTGGTISGCGRYFKEYLPEVKIIGVDCYGSIIAHYWKTGELSQANTYVLEGIGEDFIPQNYDFDLIDGFEVVGDKKSFQMTRKLLSEQGIYCGGSSGAAVLGAINYAKKIKKPEKILVLLHDSGNRYSSKIFNDSWMREHNYCEDYLNYTLKEAREKLQRKDPLPMASTQLTIKEVLELLEKTSHCALPLVNDNQVLGVVKSSELMPPLFEKTLNLNCNVSTIYSQDFICLDETESIAQGVQELKRKKIVIICSQKKPIDLLSESDVLKLIRKFPWQK